jgi:maleate cis-trans isomerase
MSNAGVDVVGQVGTNWSHAGGRTPEDIRAFCDRMADTYQTPLHMAGMCLVEGLRQLNAERIAVNAVYFWPDWRDGTVRFLRDAGFDIVWSGNFIDQGLYGTQEEVNDCTWIFPGDLAGRSMLHVAEQAPQADAIVVTGMPNWRSADGLPQRTVSRAQALEAAVGKPIVSSDFALYWNIFRTLGVAPVGQLPRLLSDLQE